MVTQQIFLPMVPDSAPIVVNISQYDFDATSYAGRLFFNLVNEGAAYDMDGASAIFQGEKPDGTTFAYPATVVNASVVRVNVRQQMTAVSGRVVCQLVVSNTDGQIGSFNIWLEVQPSSASGGDPSQTDIPALIAQAKQYADDAEQAAQDAAAWSANPPYIGANGNWFVYDTATSTYTDTGVYASGSEGNKWYTGTAVNGKDETPTVFPTGITLAREGDMYLNKSEGAIYHCTLGGAATVAKWTYDMTLTGGGGGGTDNYVDLTNKPKMNGTTLVGDKSTGDLIPLGTGLTFDPITLELSTDLLAGSNITLTPQASGAMMISATGGGGGGSTTLGGLTDVTITTPSDDQVLTYDNGIWINKAASGGGHQMIPATEDDTDVNTIAALTFVDAVQNKVVNAYTIQKYSNVEKITLLTPVTQNTDTIGSWTNTWETDGDRSGWLWHSALHGILADDDVEVECVFDIANGEVISIYAYRIDDEVYAPVTPAGTENPQDEGWYEYDGADYVLTTDTTVQAGKTYYAVGGAVAIKLNSKVQSASVKLGVNLKRQRTLVDQFEVLT